MSREPDVRAEVLAELERWRAEAAGDEKGEHVELETRLADLVAEAAEEGDVWGAVDFALGLADIRKWRWYRYGATRGEARAVATMYRAADRGWQLVDGGRKGGRGRWGEPVSNEELAQRVLSLEDSGLSWTAACEDVGFRYGISGRQVRRRVPDTKW